MLTLGDAGILLGAVVIGGVLTLLAVALGAFFVFRTKMAHLGTPFLAQMTGRKPNKKPRYYIEPEKQEDVFEKFMDEAVDRIREQRQAGVEPTPENIEAVLTGKVKGNAAYK